MRQLFLITILLTQMACASSGVVNATRNSRMAVTPRNGSISRQNVVVHLSNQCAPTIKAFAIDHDSIPIAVLRRGDPPATLELRRPRFTGQYGYEFNLLVRAYDASGKEIGEISDKWYMSVGNSGYQVTWSVDHLRSPTGARCPTQNRGLGSDSGPFSFILGTMKYISKNPEETRRIAEEFIRSIAPRERAVVVAMEGDLGTGKTAFSQYLGEALGVRAPIQSPTFLIEKIYELHKEPWRHLVHIDAYRLENEQELLHLGWKEIISKPENLILVEWADNVRNILPEDAIHIVLTYGEEENTREIEISST